MSIETNTAIAKTLLEGIGAGRDPDDIAKPFAEDLVFEIQGDNGAMPWIGRRIGRKALTEFLRDQRTMTEPVAFEVEDVLASDHRAVIVGSLQNRIKATGKVTTSQFAIILTISAQTITRFQMLEDSFDLAKAAR